ncbi:hypothetical protein OIU85_030154 [Salix viminalis]|uniref:ABC transporter domain-containing protein n=1 Tax=Salix viminalis TaxID=40686 RepID=A0A9Q0QCV9_SALVM|nr:hypothetical protein OIU85_030154 [Salix viminalis]
MAAGLFRLIAGVCRTMIIANTGGALTLLLVFLLGGFILPQGTIPNWWEWGYWLSPLSYAYKAIAVNEMFAPRWMNKLASDNATRLGTAVLHSLEVSTDKNWYWIGTAAILGFAVLFNVLFTFSLEYFSPLGKPQAIISEETINQGTQSKRGSPPQSEASSDGNSTSKMEILRMSSPSNPNGLVKTSDSTLEAANGSLDNLKDAIVGLPGITGLSTEQRKRLTIAVELVANPSIIFMDEPTWVLMQGRRHCYENSPTPAKKHILDHHLAKLKIVYAA